jgi:oligoribonuclease
MTEITMAWVDLETTGLNANSEVPLELGIVLTDNHGCVVDQYKDLVYEYDNPEYDRAWDNMIPYVQTMHDKSGLAKDLHHAGRNAGATRHQVDYKVVEWLDDHGIEPGTLPMCGNSIGSLDRPFAIVHFPKLNEFLHYRNIDISTVKELCRRLNPTLFEQIKHIVENKENATHRVLDDCIASINEYLVYVDEFLMAE